MDTSTTSKKKQSKASRFESRYSDKCVTAGQYLAEIVCENKARQDRKDLPKQFWKIKEWERYYKYQVGLAYKLLKTHKIETILKVIRGSTITSLRAPFLPRELAKQERKEAYAKKLKQVNDAPLPEEKADNRTFKKENKPSMLDSLGKLNG